MDFRWNEWNINHIASHGVSVDEAEEGVRSARPPFPRDAGDDKRLVWGRGKGGRVIQVVFVLDPEETIYDIHARPLSDKEMRRFRRIKRR